MMDEKCSTCEAPLKIAENPKEQGDRFWMIQFSYATFFFCSPEHADDYAQ